MKISDLKIKPKTMDCCRECKNEEIKNCIDPLCIDLQIKNNLSKTSEKFNKLILQMCEKYVSVKSSEIVKIVRETINKTDKIISNVWRDNLYKQIVETKNNTAKEIFKEIDNLSIIIIPNQKQYKELKKKYNYNE